MLTSHLRILLNDCGDCSESLFTGNTPEPGLLPHLWEDVSLRLLLVVTEGETQQPKPWISVIVVCV